MRCLTLLLTLIPLLACASNALAGEPPVPIEGKLLVSGWDESGGYGYFMEGTSDNRIPAPSYFVPGDVSPMEDEAVYHIGTEKDLDALWDLRVDIWKAGIDGSNQVNLTELAGLDGLSCYPSWSPDGSQIAFRHSDPVEGERPCDTGFHAWIMNSDGTGAHQVVSEGSYAVSWAPNGYRLLCSLAEGAMTIDTDGTDAEMLPNVGEPADWSPDGSSIVSSRWDWDVVEDEAGVWRQLLLTNADGSNPQVLVEQFVKDSDVEAHLQRLGLADRRDWWAPIVRGEAGPACCEWSPKGDRIAFMAAMPFDPEGPHWHLQVEVWVYDIQSGDSTKITHDLRGDHWLSWNGDNTFPSDPEVTVDNTTVTFDAVNAEGVTTIIRDDDPPSVPTYEFNYEYYDITTTADISGPISICMTYNDEDVPTGVAEEDLTILHYVEEGECWEDITTSRDPDTNTICGEVDSLSLFTLHGIRRTRFPDVPAWGRGDEGLDPYWAFWEIEACVAAGVVGGYPDGSYQPDWDVTRAQMAVFIARAIASPTGEEGVQAWEAPDTPTFPDVADYFWCYKHVEMLCEKGIVEGYPDGFYRPATWVSRDQMAVYMARAVADPVGEEGLEGYTPPAEASFLDANAEHWAYKHIEYCAENSIVAGYADGFYRPSKLVTRDQMAVYIARAFQLPI